MRRAVVPNGVSTGLDIGLSNYSLMLITLSFYTMCKSTTPVFLLIFAFLWGIERCAFWGIKGRVIWATERRFFSGRERSSIP